MDFIAIPLSYLLKFLYDTIAFQNYGLTIIFFTLVIKIIMLPLTIKQTKSTAKQQELQPEIAKLQKRYKNDKEKLNKEMMKFYKENNFNPASGCLPLLVQFPILISLYWIVLEPIKFLLQYHKIYGGNEKRMLLRKISGVPLGDMKADIGALSSFSKDDSAFNANDQLIYNKSQFIDENGNFILKNVAMQEKN
jgi:YidC/Oxa1 family membrane protein insertase